ncbi:zinc-binding dehydrogenase [Bradyrhizobium sp. CB1717]|uniref:zinc-binding dehydrogenase n=1 Tax=Bradyrhizobium sp. CB1717 TaxID=3039154 RepID=UPI0024B1A515|nr:zinc-binding dehydrogenase [Bradyrhizobium sp. CB1717]WFU23191.1 zinc-binding dehydrogenase [Bradyrhizobium sp. CB1717]
MTRTMRAIVLSEPGGVDTLVVKDVPLPQPQPGWVRIRVKAFGVNESEVTSRKGLSGPDFTMPRVLGIECVGLVDQAPGTHLKPGQQVATMMGGMGRSFDGGYAEYTIVPLGQIIPFETGLPWKVVGALPEMFQTAYGSLSKGLYLGRGQSLLIRGGTSTVGLSAAAMAKEMGVIVVSTTRRPEHIEVLREFGADYPILDGGNIVQGVRALFPNGVDAALELVGGLTLQDTLQATRTHGTVCFTGALSDKWVIPHFNPLSYIPFGVRLTAYGGQATDLPPAVFDKQLKAIAEGRLKVAVAKVYHGLEQVRQAQADLEARTTPGKHVVVLD